jgi:hypothetical protein
MSLPPGKPQPLMEYRHIVKSRPRTHIATFADDTSILITDSDPAVALYLLQTDLLAIQH